MQVMVRGELENPILLGDLLFFFFFFFFPSVVSKVAFAMTVVWKIQSNILPLIQVSTYRFLNGIGGGGVHLVF